MSETKNEVPPDAKKEMPVSVEIWEQLARVFGGFSQVPDRVVGMAIIGRVNSSRLNFGQRELDEVVKRICERWDDAELDADTIRADILGGMKEMAENYPGGGNERVWEIIHALEK